MRKALMLTKRRLAYTIALCVIALNTSGCITSGPILAETGDCSGYIPEAWRQGVGVPPLPEGVTVGDWIALSDALAAAVDKANGRLADTLHIIGECERRSAEALKRSRPKFLGVL